MSKETQIVINMKQVDVKKLLQKAAHQRDKLIYQDRNKDSKTIPSQKVVDIVCSQQDILSKKLVLRETYFTYSTDERITENIRDIDGRKLSLKSEQKNDFDFSTKSNVNLVDRSKISKEPPIRIVPSISEIKNKAELKRSRRTRRFSRRMQISQHSDRKQLLTRITNPLVQEQESKTKLESETQNHELEKAKRFLESQMILFEDYLDQLLENYLNKYVWFENGVILDSGDTHEEVAMRAYKAYGMKPVFIKRVEKDKVVFSTPTSFK